MGTLSRLHARRCAVLAAVLGAAAAAAPAGAAAPNTGEVIQEKADVAVDTVSDQAQADTDGPPSTLYELIPVETLTGTIVYQPVEGAYDGPSRTVSGRIALPGGGENTRRVP